MNNQALNEDALEFDSAVAGLDLIEHDGLFVSGPADILIERLFDQVAHRDREAFDGEDAFLRRAIECYADSNIHGAVANAMYAANIGSGALLGGMGDPDRSVPLREALAQARAQRALS